MHRYAAVFALLLCCSEPLWAMHCGKKIVAEGDHKYEVLAACGQPAAREMDEKVITLLTLSRFFVKVF